MATRPGRRARSPDEPSTLDEGKKPHTKRFHVLGELGTFAGKLEGDQRSIVMSPLPSKCAFSSPTAS